MRLNALKFVPALVLLITALLVGWFGLQSDIKRPDASAENYAIPRQVRFNYAIRNTGNRVVRKAKFYVYAPIHQTGTQLVTQIDSVVPHRVERDVHGQQLVVFDLPDLPPYGCLELAYTSRLKLSTVPISFQAQPSRVSLEVQPLIESDHPIIQRQARALKNQSQLVTARNICRWVADYLTYTGPYGKDRGALQAYESRRGDCTDAAFLTAALCRAVGMPARCVGGYVCARDKNVAGREFHNWAEFWIEGRWYVADPVNRCFVEKAEKYIATRIWTVEDEGEGASFWRHWIEDDNLKVRMVG